VAASFSGNEKKIIIIIIIRFEHFGCSIYSIVY
jgi:hypothetical protein